VGSQTNKHTVQCTKVKHRYIKDKTVTEEEQ